MIEVDGIPLKFAEVVFTLNRKDKNELGRSIQQAKDSNTLTKELLHQLVRSLPSQTSPEQFDEYAKTDEFKDAVREFRRDKSSQP